MTDPSPPPEPVPDANPPPAEAPVVQPPPADTTPSLPPTLHSILSAQQMRQAEQFAVQAGAQLIILMERAGLAVAERIFERYQKCPTLVLCGPGNNGGDGFVVARHLSAKGWPVRVLLYGKIEDLAPEAKIAASRWKGAVMTATATAVAGVIEKGARLVVDALYGIGLKRPVTGEAATILQVINNASMPVVAVDIPSGLNSDTGQIFGQAVAADMTVTFFRKKLAHVLMPGRMLCGDVVVADIGIPEEALQGLTLQVTENHPDLWSGYFPRPRLNMNKYDRGHALIYGGAQLTGASRLAALAAQRMGAGLVTIAAPHVAYMVYALWMTSIIVREFDDKNFAATFEEIIADKRINVAVIGPGAGIDDNTKAAVLAALSAKKKCVLDADAISVFARGDFEALRNALEPMHHQSVLTPHEGEFDRIFSRVADSTKDKVTRTRMAAAAVHCPVLLKGADSVIATPEGLAVVNTNAPATLATAGTGDVLAGFIGGLMAQGVDAFIASCMATWLHGAVAAEFGPCLIAEDLINGLPNILRPKPIVPQQR
jgi:ADP-dependent NAD(P)H-hydrate dehydratase / NAD(P)H-hydrate epimerase